MHTPRCMHNKGKKEVNDTVLLKEEEKRGAEILLPFNDKKNF